ncbi:MULTISPECIES: transposase [Bradyrhizobium]|nr:MULTISPECIES: transposase [Bradyrhizobium]
MQVYLHREQIDFRAGINSLAILVQQRWRSIRLLRQFLRSAIAVATG